MIKQTLKVGTHRGNKRVWIEGKNLIEAGFLPGKLYVTTFNEDDICLTVTDGTSILKTRKVSNKKGTHPIIDMNSKAISNFFEGSDSCDISFCNEIIVIEKN